MLQSNYFNKTVQANTKNALRVLPALLTNCKLYLFCLLVKACSLRLASSTVFLRGNTFDSISRRTKGRLCKFLRAKGA